jgi:hypothetical protein
VDFFTGCIYCKKGIPVLSHIQNTGDFQILVIFNNECCTLDKGAATTYFYVLGLMQPA